MGSRSSTVNRTENLGARKHLQTKLVYDASITKNGLRDSKSFYTSSFVTNDLNNELNDQFYIAFVDYKVTAEDEVYIHDFTDNNNVIPDVSKSTLLKMADIMSLTRQALQERRGGGRRIPPKTGPI